VDLWIYERELYEKGYKVIAGVDEAGRGPLAGPVYAAAAILPEGLEISGLNDSKKLSEKKRDALYDVIIESALSYGIGTASHEEIDDLNILNATYLAMNRAIEGLQIKPDMCIIDGNRSEGINFQNMCLVGGDGKSANVAAASILAKVSRDRFMLQMAEKYPEYCFEKHKGYGTKLHYEKLREFGASPIHRKTFLRKMH
jgi:ribonuclease HII